MNLDQVEQTVIDFLPGAPRTREGKNALEVSFGSIHLLVKLGVGEPTRIEIHHKVHPKKPLFIRVIITSQNMPEFESELERVLREARKFIAEIFRGLQKHENLWITGTSERKFPICSLTRTMR